VVLVAMAVVLVVTVPTLRGLVASRLRQTAGLDSRGFPLASTYAAIVSAHPQDAEMWQAYAEALWSQLETSEYAEAGAQEPVREETIDKAYQKAVELDPNSAAARFSYAVFQLDRMKLKTLPDEGVFEGEPSGALTGPQIERLQAARGLLAQCARLAPENAAVDYLVAWSYLAQQRSDEAFAALEDARAKDGWSIYQAESARAMLGLVDKTKLETMHKPMTAMSLAYAKTHAPGWRLRSLGRTLRNLGDQLRENGDHEQAIACYEALAHVGHLMRVNAHNMVDGLTAVALSAIAVSSDAWAPTDEEERLKADKELRKSELRAPGFAAYLREHGREDLAAFVLSELEAAMRWREDSHAVVKRLVPELVWDISGGGVLNAAAAGAGGMPLLGVAVLVGLLSLRARYWREPQAQAQWSYREWLVLLLVLLLPGQIAAAAFTRALWLRQEITSPVWGSLLIAGVGLGVVAWLVAVLVMTLRRRRALAEAQRFGKARSFLRGLRALVCPTLAALILPSVLGAWLVEGRMNSAAARYRQIALQGEAQYWGIGSGGAKAPPSVRLPHATRPRDVRLP